MMMNYDYDHDLMPYFMALIMRMIFIMIMAMIIATWTNWMTRLDLPTEREPMTATLRCFKGIFALCQLLVHLQIVNKDGLSPIFVLIAVLIIPFVLITKYWRSLALRYYTLWSMILTPVY